MITIGMDMARPGSDISILYSTLAHSISVGDVVKAHGRPRAECFIAKRIIDPMSFEVQCYRRPSRGYAKHLRRGKASR